MPEFIGSREKLEYNHGNIMVCEETSIGSKIIKLFPNEKLLLNKKFNFRKPDVWFADLNFIIKIDEGNHPRFDDNDEREKACSKKDFVVKLFNVIQLTLLLIFTNFLGKINCYITKLHEKEAVNLVINEIAGDFKKMITIAKSKELKRYAKIVLPTYKK